MSMSLEASSSSSSATALPGTPSNPTAPSASPTIFTIPCPCFIDRASSVLRSILGRRRRRPALARPRDVDAEVDGRLVRQLRRQVPLLVAHDGDRGGLRLRRDER